MGKKWVYSALFVLVLLVSAGMAQTGDPNLLGWWPLNEGSGEVAFDLSGNANDGAISNPGGGLGLDGSVWVDDPVRGTVISFNGTATGAFVHAGMTPQMTLTNDFTWAFWAKQDAGQTGSNDIIFGNRKDENAVDFVPRQFIKFTPTKFEWHMNGNGNDNMEYEDIPADLWLHHAVVKVGDQLTYYRNGVAGGSKTITQPLDFPQPLFLGGDNEGAEGENWRGALSDARIYNRALTRLEVQAAMAGVEQIDMEIGYAVAAPAIDGEVDAVWVSATAHSFVPLADPADASGSWKLLYDDENLYVLVEVTDDSLQNDSAAAWQDDSVEVYFDGGNTKLSTPLSGDDHQYTVGWAADDIQGTNIAGYTEGIEQAQVTTAAGWRLEMKMPWASLLGDPNAMAEARDLIGIDLYYNDDDDGGDTREGKMLTFSAVEGWNDASQWATAILGVMPAPVDPGVEGLVAFYLLDGDAHDASGNGLDGTPMGDPAWVDGFVGGAVEMDGEGDYIEVASDPLLDIVGPISLALWIRPDAADPEGMGIETAPMAKALGSASPSWSWQVRYGWNSPQPYMAFTFNTTPRAWAYVGRKLEQGEWHHIACAHDGATLTAYLNGLAADSTPMGAITVSPTPVLIGSDGWGSDWIGAIDEVAIYNRALSPEEILYLAGYRENDPEANKLVARRFFEEMWNNRNLDIVDELITADMAGHAPTGEFIGYEGEKQTILANLAGFPDLQITVDEVFAEGDRVALRTSYQGTHTGTLMGQIPPTGLPVSLTGNIIFRFENGKVAEAWSFADMLGIMQQIGVASPARSGPEDYAWSAPSETTGAPGDPESNKALIHRFVDEVWNQQRIEVMDEAFSTDVVSHNPPIEFLYGRSDLEILRQGVVDYLAAYPDLNVAIDDVVAEEDMASARWTLTGTHLGPLMGIPATGKTVTFTGITMYRFADGKIVEMWWAWDTMGMMNQITKP